MSANILAPEEQQSLRKRVDALKTELAANEPKRDKLGRINYGFSRNKQPAKAGRQRGSKIINGKLYTPEQVAKLGQGTGNRQSGGNRPASTVVPRDRREPKESDFGRDYGDARHARSADGNTANPARPVANPDDAERGQRTTEQAHGNGGAGANQGHNGADRTAAGFRDTLRKRVDAGIQRVADLGKPREDEQERGPRFQPGKKLAQASTEWLDEHGRLFSESDADETRGDVAQIIQDYGGYLDQFLTWSVRDTDACDIWSFTDEEADIIAGLWLKRAKKDRRAAAVLRMALDGDEAIQSALILGPKAIATAQWYPEHGGWRTAPWHLVDADGHKTEVERGPR